jgi:hypothetical protein
MSKLFHLEGTIDDKSGNINITGRIGTRASRGLVSQSDLVDSVAAAVQFLADRMRVEIGDVVRILETGGLDRVEEDRT